MLNNSRTLIALWNTSDKGKTATLRVLAHLLLDINTFPTQTIIHLSETPIPEDRDFRLIIMINGLRIAIETQGDPSTDLDTRLLELADQHNCDIILCATRTRGDTMSAVSNLRDNRAYNVVWTSTYETLNTAMHNEMNQLKALHLLDLMRQLSNNFNF